MEKQKMTIHRALSELKLIDSKIEKQISEILIVGIHQKGKKVEAIYTEEEFKSRAQSKFDSVMDLIGRKNAIKSAIVKANGETLVKISGKEMTIADAINFKSIIKFKKSLINRLKATHNHAVGTLNKNNEIVEQNVQKLLEFNFGKDAKTDTKDIQAVRDTYIPGNEFHLFDPLKSVEKTDAMEKEVSEFEVEVDATLSEINAITFIEV